MLYNNDWLFDVPVAQLDRVFGYEPNGWGFESLQVHQNHYLLIVVFFCAKIILCKEVISMELEKLRKISKKIIAEFVDELGLDGDYYSNLNNTLYAFATPQILSNGKTACGQYVSLNEKSTLDRLLKSKEINQETYDIATKEGLIIINPIYDEENLDINDYDDLLTTIIHETLHANRELLVFEPLGKSYDENNPESKRFSPYNYDNGHFEQNDTDYREKLADASQDILKGSIDTSKKTITKYLTMSADDIEDIESLNDYRLDNKKAQQKAIDEALVELMAKVAVLLYLNHEKHATTDIWNILEKISKGDDDIASMSKIILKHNDLELFNWMIMPDMEDIHYDFFSNYTKNDTELVEELYEKSPYISSNFEESIYEDDEETEIDNDYLSSYSKLVNSFTISNKESKKSEISLSSIKNLLNIHLKNER